ncbi:MAG TPA: flagellar biosynthetic protein FliO [Polyangiaceae bacterium]|nr:flagellar biosynthetic protein FliO [Polyangiaceae bacterium]
MRRALPALALWALSFASSAHALEPAGGPADPLDRESAADDVRARERNTEAVSSAPLEAPDASVEDRTWLGQPAAASTEIGSGIAAPNPLLTLLAIAIVALLGGGALVLQRRRRRESPLHPHEARLNLLSSTRVGPKAFAGSAEVGGRVLLLGVTDHSVTHLGWLDPPELDAPVEAAIGSERDELPDDYPGSALRAAAQSSSPLTSSGNLRRFQEVLRGALPQTGEPLIRPSAAAKPEGSGAPLGSDAASTLAALTADVFGGAQPASLRRKRQRRTELEQALPKPSEPAVPLRASAPARAMQPAPASDIAPKPDPALEGQVAGLRALRNG